MKNSSKFPLIAIFLILILSISSCRKEYEIPEEDGPENTMIYTTDAPRTALG